MALWIDGNYINQKSSERKQGRETDGQKINRTKIKEQSSSRQRNSYYFYFCVCFLSRLLWQRSERHHRVCCLFSARQRPRGVPWNNGEPLPVSIKKRWLTRSLNDSLFFPVFCFGPVKFSHIVRCISCFCSSVIHLLFHFCKQWSTIWSWLIYIYINKKI